MINKKFLFAFMFVFILTSVSALDCFATFEQDTSIDLIQRCPTCTYVNITSITYPNGTIFLNDNMTQQGTNYNYTLPDSSQVGRVTYSTIGDKNGASPPLSEDLCIEITPNGTTLGIPAMMVYIVLILFFVGLILSFYNISSRVDYERWYNSMVNKYAAKNSPKVIMSGILYGFMKEAFITYYLLFFPVIMLFREIILIAGITSISGIMDSILVIYSIGMLVVGVLFFGKMQEFVMRIVEDAKNMNWGISK